ncbi:SIMPL domain-containing protein [Oxynema aestuarii]|uniref:SIMPL domain-containing protein n=1 Tax=Oxynema aestuarii AP17 TaxID=2064643 RepID=A0A6H1TU86_9CYAN|nr:SIMPL domain-containing protein [Oxynema aestuarii]QIZ69510.1 SIMPL domain-containing protein [Oxynema aestuarii AP17]
MKVTGAWRPRLNVWSQVTALTLALGIVQMGALDPAIAQEQRLRILNVSGQGIVSIPTSLTQVSLGVEVQGKTAEEVQQEVARRSSAVVELLRSRNVEKLETTGIRLNPIYNYTNNRQIISGYSASNIVSFRIATERAGNLLDEAVRAGATRIDGISFVATDEAIAAARQQALRQATEDAQAQADTVLSTLNLTRREIVNIQINASMPTPQPLILRESAAVAQSSTPVVGGEQQVQANVSLEISY